MESLHHFQKLVRTSAACLSALGLGLLLVGCQSRPLADTSPLPLSNDPTARLSPGMTGKLGDQFFTVAAAAQVEVTQDKRHWERREFDLIGGNGIRALLLNGLNGNLREWHLLVPPQLPPVFSPEDAAALKPGHTVVADLIPTQITETWETRTKVFTGKSVLLDPSGTTLRGFTTHGTNEWMLVRWHPHQMWIHIGRSIPESEVLMGFKLTSTPQL
jgi:hypothetical protein